MRRLLLPFIIALLLTACRDNSLRTGDLLFVVADSSPISGAITAATAADDERPIVHVAMVIVDQGAPMVIEATGRHGVQMIPLRQFLDSAAHTPCHPTVIVKRLSVPFDTQAVAARAKAHLGEPYDWYYLPDNGRMYCSELVADAFGPHIFPASPMNFRAPDGTFPRFWVTLFDSLATPIPQGIPGTNPAALAASPHLRPLPLKTGYMRR